MSPIVLQNVTVAYDLVRARRRLNALWEVDLTVPEGEFLVIVGPSGCGKTTLINSVAGLVKTTGGRIDVNGRTVTGPGPDRAMELKVISAHPAWPWQQEALAMARHKSNIYIDLSGWAPKYFSPELVQYANTLIQDRVLFGTDWPTIDFDRYMEEFEQLPLKPEVRPKIMLENARKLLGL